MTAREPPRPTLQIDPPGIRRVRADADRRLIVTWKNGGESEVDVAPHFAGHAVFAPIRLEAPGTAETLFRAVRVGDWGWSVRWSDDMEIGADTLWRLALEQGAAWLLAWRTAHGLMPPEAARALGLSARMWRYYEAGSRPLPKIVRLAAIGHDARSQAA
jgi:hypothetical protein